MVDFGITLGNPCSAISATPKEDKTEDRDGRQKGGKEEDKEGKGVVLFTSAG